MFLKPVDIFFSTQYRLIMQIYTFNACITHFIYIYFEQCDVNINNRTSFSIDYEALLLFRFRVDYPEVHKTYDL